MKVTATWNDESGASQFADGDVVSIHLLGSARATYINADKDGIYMFVSNVVKVDVDAPPNNVMWIWGSVAKEDV
jgi:hypothetical protein